MKNKKTPYKINPLSISNRFLKYIITGGLSFTLEMLAFISFVKYLQINYLLGSCIAFIISVIFNYILSRHWVFDKGNKTVKIEMLYFVSIAIGGLIINQITMWTLVDILHLDSIISKVLAIIPVFSWNFYGKKLLVFSSEEKKLAFEESPTAK